MAICISSCALWGVKNDLGEKYDNLRPGEELWRLCACFVPVAFPAQTTARKSASYPTPLPGSLHLSASPLLLLESFYSNLLSVSTNKAQIWPPGLGANLCHTVSPSSLPFEGSAAVRCLPPVLSRSILPLKYYKLSLVSPQRKAIVNTVILS